MTPDDSHLLITVFKPGSAEKDSIWLLPVVGGQPRRLGEGGAAAYSPDGDQLLYSDGYAEIFLARADFSESRKLVTAHGKVHWLAFSPDGRRIRFHAPRNSVDTIWEFSADGTGLHRMLPDWEFTNHCCGTWTQDGKYFVFQATQNFRTQIWAIRENQGLSGTESPTPFQITTGALNFIRPTIAEDGKKIFAIGWQLRGEVVRRDSVSGLYVPVPGLESLSAEWLAYSRDEEWVAYVSYPEADLWRSKSDGNSRLKLTQAPMRVADPNWSPDGQSLAFSGQLPGQDWKIYIVSAEGGSPQSITAENREVWAPSWSADGKSLAFSAAGKERIQILNLATGTVSNLQGSDDLFRPRWSPDGRYVAARSNDSLQLIDFTTGLAEALIEDVQLEGFYWANDGQHIYYYDPFWRGPDRAVYRVDIRDKTVEMVARTGGVRPSWGVVNMWVGVTRDGAPLLLRDLSIHHIYALDWQPD
jgi:Tol biopolymer transport system component